LRNKGTFFPTFNTLAPGKCSDVCEVAYTPFGMYLCIRYEEKSLANGFAEKNPLEIIAIARDGHVLYGPYNDKGIQWDKNCN
jgi:hypothetical protein